MLPECGRDPEANNAIPATTEGDIICDFAYREGTNSYNVNVFDDEDRLLQPFEVLHQASSNQQPRWRDLSALSAFSLGHMTA